MQRPVYRIKVCDLYSGPFPECYTVRQYQIRGLRNYEDVKDALNTIREHVESDGLHLGVVSVHDKKNSGVILDD